MASQRATVAALLDRHGRTYAEELGIGLSRPAPSGLFQLLCAALLYSARIDAGIATAAARNLKRRGWRTAEKLAASTWKQRVAALNDAGYTRYQERTATMLGEAAEAVGERWSGDLRKLREEADRQPAAERRALKRIKGLGDVGADIFFREAQVGWHELEPFADRRALRAAERLKLPADAKRLRRLVDGRAEFARLVAALVRVELAGDHGDVRAAAR